MKKVKIVVSVISVFIMLLSSISYGSQETENAITLQEFLSGMGIEAAETTDIKYVNVREAGETAVFGTEKNAIQVKVENEKGEVKEYLVLGLNETEQTYEPIAFNSSDIAVQNTGSRPFVPSELNNAPIYLTLQTNYTTNGSHSRQINPSGIIAYYSLSGTQQAIISSLDCRFTVYGAPLKGNEYIDYAPPGYEYDGLRTGYEITRIFTSMSPNTTYSATKVFPAGYYMNVDHPVVGGSTYEAIGNVSTSSGTKSFAVHWSGL